MTDDDLEADDKKHSTATAIAVLEAKVRMLTWLFKNVLVTKNQFEPVRLIAYGIAGLIISSVIAGILSYILKKGV